MMKFDPEWTKFPIHRGSIPIHRRGSRHFSRYQKSSKIAVPTLPTPFSGNFFSWELQGRNYLYLSGVDCGKNMAT